VRLVGEELLIRLRHLADFLRERHLRQQRVHLRIERAVEGLPSRAASGRRRGGGAAGKDEAAKEEGTHRENG